MIYKAQWPLAGLKMVVIYPVEQERLMPLERDTYFLPATPQLRKHLFDGRFIKVYFEGSCLPGLAPAVKEFVRHEDWVERDPLTGELVP